MNEAERKYLRESQEPNNNFSRVKDTILCMIDKKQNKSELVKCLKNSVCFAENNLDDFENHDGKSVISQKEQQNFRKIYKGISAKNKTNKMNETNETNKTNKTNERG